MLTVLASPRFSDVSSSDTGISLSDWNNDEMKLTCRIPVSSMIPPPPSVWQLHVVRDRHMLYYWPLNPLPTTHPPPPRQYYRIFWSHQWFCDIHACHYHISFTGDYLTIGWDQTLWLAHWRPTDWPTGWTTNATGSLSLDHNDCAAVGPHRPYVNTPYPFPIYTNKFVQFHGPCTVVWWSTSLMRHVIS